MLEKTSQTRFVFVIILLVATSLFPLLVAVRYPNYLNDDTYITLVFAKNLVNGNGFVYNHPPAVLGTTTPLLTLIIAGLATIFRGVNLSTLAIFFTALCWGSLMWVLFFFRREWGLEDWQVCILALILVGSGWIAYLGMEAYLFALLLLLCFSLFIKKRYGLAGFLSAMLFLTRGEGVLILGVLLSALLVQNWVKRKPLDNLFFGNILKIAVGFTIPIITWAAYAYFTFGSIIPNTLAAKQAQDQTGMWHSFAQRLLLEWMPTWGKSLTIHRLPLANFWWLFVVAGFVDVLLRKQKWLILIVWIVLYITAYSLLNVSGYWWYELPILFVLNILFGLGIMTVIDVFVRYLKPDKFALSLSVLFTIILVFFFSKPVFSALATNKGDQRGASYTALSLWFRENTKPSDSVAFIEIGYLGYYTNNRIIDLAGLILPSIVPHIAEGDFAWGFWEYKPDYYAYLPDFDWALASIKADPRFDQQYRPVATISGPKGTDFIIFKRQGR
jgi:hypothetical protein